MSTRFPTVLARKRVDQRPPQRQRSRGHAFHAERAREALGVTHLGGFGDVPTSLFHIVAGCAVSLAAVAVRPQSVGMGASVTLDIVLAVMTLAVLVVHEHAVTGAAGVRAGVEPGLLPGAALLALCLVLAGDADWRVGAPSVVLVAAIIALVPRLDADLRLGKATLVERISRQLLGIVIVAPILVAVATTSLPVAARVAIGLLGMGAVGMDAAHVEGQSGYGAVVGPSCAAVLVCALALLPSAAAAPYRGGMLLIVWYSARSLAATVANGTVSRAAFLEYGILGCVAAIALEFTSRR